MSNRLKNHNLECYSCSKFDGYSCTAKVKEPKDPCPKWMGINWKELEARNSQENHSF